MSFFPPGGGAAAAPGGMRPLGQLGQPGQLGVAGAGQLGMPGAAAGGLGGMGAAAGGLGGMRPVGAAGAGMPTLGAAGLGAAGGLGGAGLGMPRPAGLGVPGAVGGAAVGAVPGALGGMGGMGAMGGAVGGLGMQQPGLAGARPPALGGLGGLGGAGAGLGGIGGAMGGLGGAGLGGAGALGGMGAMGAMGAMAQQQNAAALQTTSVPQSSLEMLALAFDANYQASRFKFMLYNWVPPEEIGQYTYPQGTNELLWHQAVENNPDPTRMVPVQANGFRDLQERIKQQDEQIERHASTLENIDATIQQITQQHELNTMAKVEEYRRRHAELSHRVLRLVSKLEVLRRSGNAVSDDEESLRGHLENLQRELNKPTQFKGRLNELMSQIRMQHQSAMSRSDQYEILDPDAMRRLHKHLSDQTTGISQLRSVLKEDVDDTELMKRNLHDNPFVARGRI